jgi:hypothetical protein
MRILRELAQSASFEPPKTKPGACTEDPNGASANRDCGEGGSGAGEFAIREERLADFWRPIATSIRDAITIVNRSQRLVTGWTIRIRVMTFDEQVRCCGCAPQEEASGPLASTPTHARSAHVGDPAAKSRARHCWRREAHPVGRRSRRRATKPGRDSSLRGAHPGKRDEQSRRAAPFRMTTADVGASSTVAPRS